MNSKDFAYWLQGLFELSNPTTLDAKQTELIKRHLALVFKHEIDSSYGDKAHQEELNKIHNPHPLGNGPINITQEGLDKLKKMNDEFSAKRQKHAEHINGNCDCHAVYRC